MCAVLDLTGKKREKVSGRETEDPRWGCPQGRWGAPHSPAAAFQGVPPQTQAHSFLSAKSNHIPFTVCNSFVPLVNLFRMCKCNV